MVGVVSLIGNVDSNGGGIGIAGEKIQIPAVKIVEKIQRNCVV